MKYLRSSITVILLLAVIGMTLSLAVADAPADQTDLRKLAQKLQRDGNWKEAYTILAKLATDPKDDPVKVGQDLSQAVQCLNRLGRQSEMDPLI